MQSNIKKFHKNMLDSTTKLKLAQAKNAKLELLRCGLTTKMLLIIIKHTSTRRSIVTLDSHLEETVIVPMGNATKMTWILTLNTSQN